MSDAIPDLPEGVHTFLDLSTAHLPEGEMQRIKDAPTRVIDHEYGAFVHVHRDFVEQDDETLRKAGFPKLVDALAYARQHGCWWINFDQDAHTIDALPSWEW